eukprot:524154_1
MSTLLSTIVEATNQDVVNHKRRYTVMCMKKMEKIGITYNGVNILDVTTDHATKAFHVPSKIIRINDTSFLSDTSTTEVTELVIFARDHPGSVFECECSDKLFIEGIHFQLNLDVIDKYPIERVLKQITYLKLETIISKIFRNKQVEIYDIVTSDHCRGAIIFGFISHGDYECEHILNNIKKELNPYNELRIELSKIFETDHNNKYVQSMYFEWTLNDIITFSEDMDKDIGVIGQDRGLMETLWKKIQHKNHKESVRDMIRLSMRAYVLTLFWEKMCGGGLRVNDIQYLYQRDLWCDMMTNWFYNNNIFEGGDITLDQFIDIFSINLNKFYHEIKESQIQSNDWNPSLVVYRFLNEHCRFIPNEIIHLIKIYFIDIPIHIVLKRFFIGQRSAQLNRYMDNISAGFIPISSLIRAFIAGNEWIIMITSPQNLSKFNHALKSHVTLDVLKKIGCVMERDKYGNSRSIPERVKERYNRNFGNVF